MGLKKGVAHIALFAVIVLALLIGTLVLAKFVFNKKVPFLGSEKPNVALKSTYENPFDKNTQYVNPFEEVKNPFVNIKNE